MDFVFYLVVVFLKSYRLPPCPGVHPQDLGLPVKGRGVAVPKHTTWEIRETGAEDGPRVANS